MIRRTDFHALWWGHDTKYTDDLIPHLYDSLFSDRVREYNGRAEF